eukprot:gene25866-31651_t
MYFITFWRLGGEQEAVNGRHRNWLPFRWRSVELMVASVQSGYNVIFTNPGVSWLRDPRPDFQQLADVDLALLPLYRNAEYQKWLAGNDIGSPGPVSGDMFFMRSSPQGRAFGRQWIAAGAQEIHKIGHRSFHEAISMAPGLVGISMAPGLAAISMAPGLAAISMAPGLVGISMAPGL